MCRPHLGMDVGAVGPCGKLSSDGVVVLFPECLFLFFYYREHGINKGLEFVFPFWECPVGKVAGNGTHHLIPSYACMGWDPYDESLWQFWSFLRPVHTCDDATKAKAIATLAVHTCTRHRATGDDYFLLFLLLSRARSETSRELRRLWRHSIRVLWQNMTSGSLASCFRFKSDGATEATKFGRDRSLSSRDESDERRRKRQKFPSLSSLV